MGAFFWFPFTRSGCCRTTNIDRLKQFPKQRTSLRMDQSPPVGSTQEKPRSFELKSDQCRLASQSFFLLSPGASRRGVKAWGCSTEPSLQSPQQANWCLRHEQGMSKSVTPKGDVCFWFLSTSMHIYICRYPKRVPSPLWAENVKRNHFFIGFVRGYCSTHVKTKLLPEKKKFKGRKSKATLCEVPKTALKRETRDKERQRERERERERKSERVDP